MIKRQTHPLAAIAAAGLLTATFSLSHPSVSHAQVPPPPPPAANPGAPLAPPPPVDQPLAQPVDPKAASAAVKTANDTLAGLKVGQVWARTAPHGEKQVQASLVFDGKEVAHLNFDPATNLLRARGEGPLPPAGPRGPGAPGGAPVPPAGAPVPPPPDSNASAPAANAPASNTPAPAAPVNLDPVKSKLGDLIKGLSVGQGAEIMPREGFWKVPLIYQNRVVGELQISGDGAKVIQDFGAARDAAIFAR